ncbi:ATP-binding protein [Rhodococcus opacus]|uniref:ATP-binding protein n=1 Tax=Rhodococcus opacus TaxID=37919 RepID=UPI00389A2037
MSGPLSVVTSPLADHAEAVLREALSNVVHHAHAHQVDVTVSVDDDLTICVTDDGRHRPGRHAQRPAQPHCPRRTGRRHLHPHHPHHRRNPPDLDRTPARRVRGGLIRRCRSRLRGRASGPSRWRVPAADR